MVLGQFTKHTVYEVSNLQDVIVKIAQSEQEKEDAFFIRSEISQL